jgi:hypothetical protein
MNPAFYVYALALHALLSGYALAGASWLAQRYVPVHVWLRAFVPLFAVDVVAVQLSPQGMPLYPLLDQPGALGFFLSQLYVLGWIIVLLGVGLIRIPPRQ